MIGRKISIWALAALVGGLWLAQGARADEVADFYQGKKIDMYIGYSPGGGYDTYARLLARHMPRHLPGHPTMVPKNMPGAGSLKLVNYLYNIAPKDGSAIGTFGRGMAMEPLLGSKGTKFDPKKLTWIGSLNNAVSLCGVWHTQKVKTWDDLMTTELVVGSTGSGADTHTFPKVMNNVLGTRFKIVAGYSGNSEILLAMERGEVGGSCGLSWSRVKARNLAWVKEKKLTFLVQMSLNKHPELPDLPLVIDLAKTEEQKKVLRLIFARQVMGRPFAAPPGIPAARAAALKKAFDLTSVDKDFLAEAKKSKLEITPIGGDEIGKLIEEIYLTPPAVVEMATRATTD